LTESQIIDWLLKGDVAIQYQVHRDLLGSDKPALQNRIALEGWGRRFLGKRKKTGHWGEKFYFPKWTCTHYTLLDLKNLGIANSISEIRESIHSILATGKTHDGGVLPIGPERRSDVCVNGMLLNYASYFRIPDRDLKSIVDFLLDERMPDGGFNCFSNRNQCTHSSVHSTLSVMEGIREYVCNGYAYRSGELKDAERRSKEFLLQHSLFRSHRTGEIIDKKMLMLSYPSRWRYDILRALDYLQLSGADYHPAMQDAIDVLNRKRRKDGTWPVQAKHTGSTHFDMEKTGGPSRWNTLRALRVLRHFDNPV
jgi:hypothetical protein